MTRGRASGSRWREAALIGVIGSIFGANALALDGTRPVNSYLRTQFTTESGLPSDTINGIAQADGFLWIATPDMLVRFDGRHFVPIRLSPKPGEISSVAAGPDGTLWIGTTTGIGRLDTRAMGQLGSFALTTYLPSVAVTVLYFSSDKVLWIGANSGLYRVDGHTVSSVAQSEPVSRIEELHNGHLLLVTGNGPIEWNGVRAVPRLDLAGQYGRAGVYHVYEDHSGRTWIASSEGLTRVTGANSTRLILNGDHGKPEPAFRVFEERNGAIWVATSSGMYRLSGDSFEHLLPVTGGRAWCEDADGNLWIGTKGSGLVRLRDRPVRMFDQSDGLPNNTVTSVMAAHDGRLWVGNNCVYGVHADASGGISIFDRNRFRTFNERDGLTSSCVSSLGEDANNDIWVGTYGGIFRFHLGHFSHFSKAEGLNDDQVRELAVAIDGSVWVATVTGISHFVNSRFRNYGRADGLSGNGPYRVYPDHRGTIWAGSHDKLQRLEGDHWVTVIQIENASYESVVGEDPAGSLYLEAKGVGVARLIGSKAMSFEPGIDAESMETYGQNSWFAGSFGIQRVPSQELTTTSPEREGLLDYSTFGIADGLTSLTFYRRLAVTPDAKLWAPTARGLAMVDLRFGGTTDKPITYIAAIEVDRRRQSPGSELRLPPGSHHVELNFDSIELTAPERTRLQYRMEGVDTGWFDAGAIHTAVYTTIPLGRHRFRVRASNRDGFWDREGISYWITQEPYYYETIYFRAALLGAVLLVIAGLYRMRLRQSAATLRAQLEGRLAERERIARDLHDTLLQSIQGLILLFEVGTKRIPEEDPVRRFLEEALSGASSVIAEGRDRVQDLRNPRDASNDLAVKFRQLCEEFTTSPKIGLTVVTEGKPRPIEPGVVEEAYWIARESVVNALMHSGCTRIVMDINYDRRKLEMFFRDNGRGIDSSIQKAGGRMGHWGLAGMRERAKRIGGILEINSEPHKGTVIVLKVPSARAYATQKRPSPWLRLPWAR